MIIMFNNMIVVYICNGVSLPGQLKNTKQNEAYTVSCIGLFQDYWYLAPLPHSLIW